ncbi:MAG: SLC13 family permease [Halodesulfurarchaeum sp.]
MSAVAGRSRPVLDPAEDAFVAVSTDQRIEAGDVLVVKGRRQAITRLRKYQGFRRLVDERVTQKTFDEAPAPDILVKAVVPDESKYVGESLADTSLREFHRTTVLAIRRAGEVFRTELETVTIEAGDLLLLQTDGDAVQFFTDVGDLIVIDRDSIERRISADAADLGSISSTAPIAVAIMAGVVGTAALGLLSIVTAALAGVVLMIVTGSLSSADAYDAVSWNVIFLLAGVIPLGTALEATGGAAIIADGLLLLADVLPPVGLLFVLYLFTGALASLITPVATIVLMLPVAVDAALRLDVNAFSFLLGVTFGAATAFMTPIGYQTNLMVYAPGDYEFTDFLRVGGPLQLLTAVVAVIGITTLWGL